MTQSEIKAAIQALQEAMLESLEASKEEDKAKLRSIKAQNNLRLARQEISALSIK